MVDPFAPLSGLLPVFRSSKIVEPPGKCLALLRSSVVDGALFPFQENAVSRAGLIDQGEPVLLEAGILLDKFLGSELKMFCEAFEI